LKSVRYMVVALFCVLVVTIPELAGARDAIVVRPGNQLAVVSVDQMPPVMRAAYLKGIRDELLAHGYDPGPDDVAYDDRFATAIQRYQIDAGLRPDGVASKALLEHLLFALPKVYADGSRAFATARSQPIQKRIALAPPTQALPHPDAESVPSPVPRQRVTAEPLDDLTTNGRPNPGPPQTLVSPGIHAGPEGFVSKTQRALRDRGYYSGPIDGRFSDALSNAIRAFQKNNRLPATGVIDAPLLGALS